jgi:hypothetical protein
VLENTGKRLNWNSRMLFQLNGFRITLNGLLKVVKTFNAHIQDPNYTSMGVNMHTLFVRLQTTKSALFIIQHTLVLQWLGLTVPEGSVIQRCRIMFFRLDA